ncbi:DUF998 domain-containing protein [Nocardioides sp. WS12]|uniref:DUF998 domain-containing protein n=1 Tax=Nocardioides sp. WS12 TaxID=2486272 RepID=UPI0015FBAD2A|nr:DUF998 domain-containing protein [Nocardioides sp. WS12]
MIASALLPGVMAGLTLRQRDFLDRVGWSPVGRTDTQWPSLLALGPDGWVLSAAFACSAVAIGAQAAAVFQASGDRRGRGVGMLIGAGAVGLAAVAFPADLPGTANGSWHAAIHNGFYPLIPLCTTAAAALHGYGRPAGAAPSAIRVSQVMAPLMLVSFAGTAVDEVAQLSRYFAFTLFAAWLAMIGAQLVRQGDFAATRLGRTGAAT